ncbi:drug/metabolite transporter (DMT)-like permease [Pseudomonas sp. TE3610]
MMALPMTDAPRALRDRLLFALIVTASTFLMGSSFVAGKVLLNQSFEPLMLVGWRFCLAAVATLPLVRLHNRSWRASLAPRHLRPRHFALIAVIGLVQTAAVMSLLFLAMQTVSASTAAILLFSNPVWVALGARLFYAQALKAMRIAGLAIGAGGVALAVGADLTHATTAHTWQGVTLGLAAALCWASATLIIKHNPVPMGTWAISFWQMLIGGLAVLAGATLAGEHWPVATTTEQWGWFVWLAIPASTGSFGLWFVALKRADAATTSGYLFLAPLFAALLSWEVLDVPLTVWQGLGGVLVGLSIWLINR